MKGEAVVQQLQSRQGEHMIAELCGVSTGPTLVVVGSIHGNEPSGAGALRRVLSDLESMRGSLRGRVYFILGNTRGLARDVRFIDSDLNRHWTDENITKVSSGDVPGIAEDYELSELLTIFRKILSTARNEVYILDLHSTSAEGLPFATVGDTLRNRHFARKFPVTILLGIEEQLNGTMLEYLNNEGAVTLGFEGGQHCSSKAVDNHVALVWLALVNSGMLADADVPGLEKHKRNLLASTEKAMIVEVRHREAISAGDEFRMEPGFENFMPVRRGQILASSRRGSITAVETGIILMPLYQKQGEDGFFIGRKVAPFWLLLSAILRKLHVADIAHFLPGVRRHESDKDSFEVDTRVARFFPLQLFHLFGFRRLRWQKYQLIVSRRRHDTESPFLSRKS